MGVIDEFAPSNVTVILAAVSGLFIILLIAYVLKKRKELDEQDEAEEQEVGVRRRILRGDAPRNARARLRAAAARVENDDDSDEHSEKDEKEKMGAKKRAKLEAKAEKKAMREAEEREREEKKKKKEQVEEERRKQELKEELDEARKEEEERFAEEERIRKEHEEYLKMKAAFSIDEEGYDDNDTDEEHLLHHFIQHIKTSKVVILEDVAAQFKLKTQAVIDRIKDLQANGQLTGVIDDRGKFIYISREELDAVAKFVKQRGRVSLSELAENSERLINLNPSIIVDAS